MVEVGKDERRNVEEEKSTNSSGLLDETDFEQNMIDNLTKENHQQRK